MKRARPDPAGGAFLARLLGEEAERLREEPQHGIRGGEDLQGGGAGARAPFAQGFPVSGTSSASGGRIPLAAPPGTSAPISAVHPPRLVDQLRAVTPSGAS